MRRGERTRLSVEERRAQLLEQGREIFSEHAYDAISTDDLARFAGISKGLLYHYFNSKRGYYVATIEAAARDLDAALQLDPALPPYEALVASHTAFLDWIEAHNALYSAVVRGGVGSDPECAAIVEAVHLGILARMLSALGIAREELSPRLRSRLIGWIGFSEALSLDWLQQRDLAKGEILQLILDGWRPIVLEELPDSELARFLPTVARR